MTDRYRYDAWGTRTLFIGTITNNYLYRSQHPGLRQLSPAALSVGRVYRSLWHKYEMSEGSDSRPVRQSVAYCSRFLIADE